jgi:3-deoxy-D-manno-octulosonic-acid transferase
MSVLLFFYNLLFPVLFLCILPAYLPRMFRRGGYKNRFLQRLGIFDASTAKRLGKGRLWVHAVSVGEVLIALKFIRRFKERHPEARFLLSITTTTALEIAEKEASDWLEPVANPIDFFLISNYLLTRFQPSALITVEGDLWIQRLFYAKKRGIPTALISARLSKRSESRFKQFRYLIAPIFNALDFIGYPSLQDEERWRALGIAAHENSVTGNIKFDQEGVAPALPPADLSQVFTALGWEINDPVFLAGSTCHLAEEEVVLNAWLSLRERFPDLRLILAPRHAERRHEIVELLKKYELTVALRSEKNSPHSADVFLLDTTGELIAWYVAAKVIFIGKSLGMEKMRGGHNPVEPLVLGRPALVGPYMENFQPLVAHLLAACGILEVKNAEEMALVTERLLLAPEEAVGLVERGMHVLKQDQGATERTCIALEGVFISNKKR